MADFDSADFDIDFEGGGDATPLLSIDIAVSRVTSIDVPVSRTTSIDIPVSLT